MKRALLATCLTASMLAATPGFAQSKAPAAPPGYGEPPPGYAPPPPGYAPAQPGYPPPGYAQPGGYPPEYGQPQFYYPPPPMMGPPPRMERRSKGMMAGGIVLIGVGALSLITGLVTYAVGSIGPYQSSNCYGSYNCGGSYVPDSGTRTAGIVLMVGGVAGLGVGIPLTVIGAKKVPVDPQTGEPKTEASTTPTLRIGPTNASLQFAF